MTSEEIEAIEKQIRRIWPVSSARFLVGGLGFLMGTFLFFGMFLHEPLWFAVAGIFFVAAAGVYSTTATANVLKQSIERLLEERADRDRQGKS